MRFPETEATFAVISEGWSASPRLPFFGSVSLPNSVSAEPEVTVVAAEAPGTGAADDCAAGAEAEGAVAGVVEAVDEAGVAGAAAEDGAGVGAGAGVCAEAGAATGDDAGAAVLGRGDRPLLSACSAS